MDTPVIPTSAFAGAGYNNPDCAYPALTPAIGEVDGDGIGPWVSAVGHTLTIYTIHGKSPATGVVPGDLVVPNNAYSGPSATTSPFNQKTVTRHYGFGGTQGTGKVTIGGITAPVTSGGWSDTRITVTVPSGVPLCAIQQQPQYGGPSGSTTFPFARCGELVITSGNGKQSIDAVTVTIGGKNPPTRLTPGQTIQSAIDAALPGDLIIIPPGVYNELLLMWKPVRLQGVGAASSVINANTHPSGKLDVWRAKINCLFGLALNGQPYSTPGHLVPLPGGGGNEPLNVYDPTGAVSCGSTNGTAWTGFNATPNNPQVDRLPLEATVGWDTTLNGNLAQLLQEPSLMGAYEGAGITVLGKGVRYPAGVEVFGAGPDTAAGSNIAHEGQFPISSTAGTVELTNSNADCSTLSSGPNTGYTSNFQCNPSSIDGLAITNSSQGGGGIFVHAWGHNLEIANNRITNNTGTLTGGISVGQGESPDALLTGNGGNPLAPGGGFDQQPWTCVPGAVVSGQQIVSPPGFATNDQLPYCYNLNVNIHNNSVTQNSAIGDEVFSGTPAGAGGVSLCIGADYYKFNYNWVCGNLSTGDGGGLAHIGFSYKGDIEHNSILLNQSTNPTIPANGGGVIIMGAAPDGAPAGAAAGTECGSVTDVDCAPGLSDGTGPGLVINANLIMGNAAESGSGGGIRFQHVDGREVGFFHNGNQSFTRPDAGGGSTTYPTPWYSINVTNNIITNNVAGWDGAGVSLQDALAVNFINNTVMSNDTTASSGVLFNTLGAPLASAPGTANQTTASTTSAPQPAGLVTMQNTPLLTASMTGSMTCPSGHGTAGNCQNFSVPLLANDVFWDNRTFYIGVGTLGTGTLNQQNVVALYNAFTTTQVASEPTADATAANGTGTIITGGTGACVAANTHYWEIGVRGDTGPANHGSGLTLAPTYSVLTDAADYSAVGSNNTANNPTVLSQYCNGSRTPPEFKSSGYQVPPGISDATVPNPIFNLTPAATVDEGNNWINISWGPLAMTAPVTGTTLGNYGPASTSSVRDYIPSSATPNFNVAPNTDFFGTLRKTNNAVDAGAVEFQAPPAAIASVTGGPLPFGAIAVNTTSAARTLTLHNTGTATLTGITVVITAPFSRSNSGPFPGTQPNCGTTLAASSNCSINVIFSPTATVASTGSATITGSVTIAGSPVTLTGTGVAPVVSGVLAPPTRNFGTVARGNFLGPIQVFTLTNNGNVPLTGITQAALSGLNPTEFSIIRLVSTCGPAGNGQLAGQTTLAPGAACVVSVQFRPLTTQPLGAQAASVSVIDAAGTQTSTLTGTAQ